MLPLQLLCALRSYYRGCRNRDLREFYNLESCLPYFDHAGHILGAHKRRILLRWMREAPIQGPLLEVGSGIGTFARQLGRCGPSISSKQNDHQVSEDHFATQNALWQNGFAYASHG